MEQANPLLNTSPLPITTTTPVNPPSSNKSVLIILLVVFVIVLISLNAYLFMKLQNPAQAPVVSPAPVVQTSPATTPDPTANWKIYKNNGYGFEFKYPRNLEAVEKEFGPSSTSTGYKFSLALIPEGKSADLIVADSLTGDFTIGSVTSDFTSGRGALFTDTGGYIEKDGKIYCIFLNDKIEINKKLIRTKSINVNGVEILTISGEPFGGMTGDEAACNNPGPEHIGVLVNLPNNKKYRGLGILFKKDSPYLSQEIFDQILSTFKFLE